MKARGFYKSRLFWCGVPGLVFLLWVWWDSGGYDSVVRWNETGRTVDVRVNRGTVVWGDTRDNSSSAPGDGLSVDRYSLPEYEWTSQPSRRGRRFDFPAAVERKGDAIEGTEFGFDFRSVSLALWVVVAGYVVVWMGAVIAWERRKVRVMKRLTEVDGEKEVLG